MDKMFIKLNMKIKFKKHILPLFALLVLTNCSAIAPASMESSFKYLGIAKGAVDVASYNATGKTSTDHLFSAAIGKDCKISRIIKRQPICVEFDAKVFKYKLYNKGKLISKNNVVNMKFPSEIYEFKKSFNKDVKSKLKSKNLKNRKF